jgi:hypothetical protein
VLAPERDPSVGRYRRPRLHADKERAHAAPRPRTRRIVAGGIGLAALLALIVLLATRGGGDDAPASAENAAPTEPAVTNPPTAAPTSPPTTTVRTTTTAATTTSTTSTTTTTIATTTTTTIAPTTTTAVLTLADGLAGTYQLDSVVLQDSLAPERAGSKQPWLPLSLSVTCDADPCTVTDAVWGAGPLVDDTFTFTLSGQADCLGKARSMDVTITLTIGEIDVSGLVKTLTGTAHFDWGGVGNCLAFVEDYALTATRT